MSTAPAPTSTLEKVAVAGAIADTVLKPLSGADDNSNTAQGIGAGVATAGEVAKVFAPQYSKEIQLAETLEPVAYHAGLAIAHFLQHLFHKTVSTPAQPVAAATK